MRTVLIIILVIIVFYFIFKHIYGHKFSNSWSLRGGDLLETWDGLITQYTQETQGVQPNTQNASIFLLRGYRTLRKTYERLQKHIGDKDLLSDMPVNSVNISVEELCGTIFYNRVLKSDSPDELKDVSYYYIKGSSTSNDNNIYDANFTFCGLVNGKSVSWVIVVHQAPNEPRKITINDIVNKQSISVKQVINEPKPASQPKVPPSPFNNPASSQQTNTSSMNNIDNISNNEQQPQQYNIVHVNNINNISNNVKTDERITNDSANPVLPNIFNRAKTWTTRQDVQDVFHILYIAFLIVFHNKFNNSNIAGKVISDLQPLMEYCNDESFNQIDNIYHFYPCLQRFWYMFLLNFDTRQNEIKCTISNTDGAIWSEERLAPPFMWTISFWFSFINAYYSTLLTLGQVISPYFITSAIRLNDAKFASTLDRGIVYVVVEAKLREEGRKTQPETIGELQDLINNEPANAKLHLYNFSSLNENGNNYNPNADTLYDQQKVNKVLPAITLSQEDLEVYNNEAVMISYLFNELAEFAPHLLISNCKHENNVNNDNNDTVIFPTMYYLTERYLIINDVARINSLIIDYTNTLIQMAIKLTSYNLVFKHLKYNFFGEITASGSTKLVCFKPIFERAYDGNNSTEHLKQKLDAEFKDIDTNNISLYAYNLLMIYKEVFAIIYAVNSSADKQLQMYNGVKTTRVPIDAINGVNHSALNTIHASLKEALKQAHNKLK